ncbi:tetratricopeptide repeat protein [Streptomyces sp. NBC_01537]|uniref:BTAD domain-containing putative transcriptional regulator n=1 Tax=Streptomyces sp. NBC_01537 TaxID=2903896 RepID=UPI003867EFE9
MRFGILGETRARLADGSPAAVGGPARRALLAMLLLEAGRIITVERLIDGLYGEDPPAGVANALQSQVSRLRSALRVPIENHPAGYRLAIDAGDVDVHRFERLAAQGRDALAGGEPARAAGMLREALALWRGSALADVGYAPFAEPQVTRLEELRIAAVEDRIAAELALDAHRHLELVAELRELVVAYPLRERLRAQLMRALYSCGRQSEALQVYEEARRELAEALGADPGRELAEAHLAVLRGDPGPVVSRETAASTDVSRETSPGWHPLPAQLTSFVGRDGELARIGSLLGRVRLVTLLGPGGAGKTRTAVEAGARHPGEVCFVDLSALTDGGDVPQAVAWALGLRESGLRPAPGASGHDAAAPDPLARLLAALADRELLLVLDNCEHLVSDAARLAAGLLAGCARVRILATSREALGITGETLCPLEPLPGVTAAQLFAERAAAVSPDFDPAAESEAVRVICAALDGMPLAIELAAARLRSLTATEIAARISADDRFRLLSRGSRTAQPRQQTLRGVVDWSWDLLADSERTVLRRASVFAGGWTLAAAEAVCADGDAVEADEVLDLIDSLVEKSLVVAYRPDGPAGGGPLRYRLLETIRAYGGERLGEAAETEALRRAHAEYFIGLARSAERYMWRAEQVHWLRVLAADHDNLHAVLRRAAAAGDTGTALQVIAALSSYWLLRGLRYEGAASARQVLAALGAKAPEGLEEEYVLGVLAGVSDLPDSAMLAEHVAAAEVIVNGIGRISRRYPALTVIWAPFAGVPEDTEGAYALLDAFLAEEDDPWLRALARIGACFQMWMVELDVDAAERECGEALTAFRRLGDRWGMITSLSVLSEAADHRGDAERAIAITDEALALADEMDAVQDTAELLSQRAAFLIRAGRHEEARADCLRAAELARRAGAPEFAARAHMVLAESARLRGDLPEAWRLGERALADCPAGYFSSNGTRVAVFGALIRTAVARGDAVAARAYYREAVVLDHARHLPLPGAVAAETFAGLALLEGGPERAAELLGMCRTLRGSDRLSDSGAERTAAGALAALGTAAYEAAFERGSQLSREQALRALTDPL